MLVKGALTTDGPAGRVAKAPYFDFSVSKIFDPTNVPIRYLNGSHI